MDHTSPVIYLLSAGADPTDSIEGLARKKRRDVACVSMGEVRQAIKYNVSSALTTETNECFELVLRGMN